MRKQWVAVDTVAGDAFHGPMTKHEARLYVKYNNKAEPGVWKLMKLKDARARGMSSKDSPKIRHKIPAHPHSWRVQWYGIPGDDDTITGVEVDAMTKSDAIAFAKDGERGPFHDITVEPMPSSNPGLPPQDRMKIRMKGKKVHPAEWQRLADTTMAVDMIKAQMAKTHSQEKYDELSRKLTAMQEKFFAGKNVWENPPESDDLCSLLSTPFPASDGYAHSTPRDMIQNRLTVIQNTLSDLYQEVNKTAPNFVSRAVLENKLVKIGYDAKMALDLVRRICEGKM